MLGVWFGISLLHVEQRLEINNIDQVATEHFLPFYQHQQLYEMLECGFLHEPEASRPKLRIKGKQVNVKLQRSDTCCEKCAVMNSSTVK
jgi:hypothetical protein